MSHSNLYFSCAVVFYIKCRSLDVLYLLMCFENKGDKIREYRGKTHFLVVKCPINKTDGIAKLADICIGAGWGGCLKR